jgi:hypothetical protein
MGNNCTNFNINKYCIDGDNVNIKIIESDNKEEKEEEKENKNDKESIKDAENIPVNEIIEEQEQKEKDAENENKEEQEEKEKEDDVLSMSQIISISNKKNKPPKNSSSNNNLETAQMNNNNDNMALNNENKAAIKKTPTAAFTNFIQDFGSADKNDVFEINYISMKNNYNEEMNDYLNKIRNDPQSIIEDINNLLKEEKIDENQKIRMENEETHETIVFNDEGYALKETKNFLSKAKSVKEKFNLNDDLLIDVNELDKNETNFNKKIMKILVAKRKKIIEAYPQCQFFVNFIKDAKINLIYLLSEKEDKSNFRKVVFDPIYTQFNVSWNIEKKNNFITFLCFA